MRIISLIFIFVLAGCESDLEKCVSANVISVTQARLPVPMGFVNRSTNNRVSKLIETEGVERKAQKKLLLRHKAEKDAFHKESNKVNIETYSSLIHRHKNENDEQNNIISALYDKMRDEVRDEWILLNANKLCKTQDIY